MDVDLQRQKAISYKYLCHLEEVRKWLENILNVTLPVCTSFEERLRNGVLLAKLSHFIAPEIIPVSKIYDYNEEIYDCYGLKFKHTENINHWLSVLKIIHFPQTFHPETTDVYNKNNMPKVIYCLHALIAHLHRLKQTPLIEYLHGKIAFTDEEIEIINSELQQCGHNLPAFHSLQLGSQDSNYNSCKQLTSEDKAESCTVKISKSLETYSYEEFVNALRDPSLNIDESKLKDSAMPLYFMELKEDYNQQKSLRRDDIQSSINILFSIANISEAVDLKCPEKTWVALNNALVSFKNLHYEHRYQYLKALTACKRFLVIQNCDCSLLSFMNIQDCIDLANGKTNNNLCNSNEDELLELLNSTITDRESFYSLLVNSGLNINKQILNLDNISVLQKYLQDILNGNSNIENTFHLQHVKEGIEYVEYLESKVKSDMNNLRNLNDAISNKNVEELSKHITSLSYVSTTDSKVVATLLISEKINKKGDFQWLKHFVIPNLEVYIDLSESSFCWNSPDCSGQHTSCYISFMDIQRINNYVKHHEIHGQICKLQALCKGFLFRRKLRLKNIKPNTDKTFCDIQRAPAVIIQAAWRGYRIRKILRNISQFQEVNFKNMKLFFSLVNVQITDYEKEINLQAMREQAVQAIRKNIQLKDQINKMDINIGLLIQNRISLMDAVTESKKIGIGLNGITSLKAGNRRILEGYQHLFYTLQTSPYYLASLIFCLPQIKCTKFLQSVIFSLYNFGANHRNEHLLLKLFQFTLHEEIRSKFNKPSEVITGNPLILNMVVNYARQTSGPNVLRNILSQLIHKVLNDKEGSIETNPVSIYNHWRNQIEMESGKSSSLPYNISLEEALTYDEVSKRFNQNIELLKSYVLMFLKRIVSLKDTMPYVLRFIARELKIALSTKFPNAPAKEITKVLGNMLYYKFINSAIVAPDAFEIIGLPAGQTLTRDNRHTLASIAKILQFAAAKKGYGEESKHLMALNPFIIDCHKIFKQFFEDCSLVEGLDEHYCINEYSEATLIMSPTIYITLQEIIETHSLLKEYEKEVASNPHDPLRELLKDLDPIPTLAQLSGHDCDNESDERRIAMTEVCLTLSNKFEGEIDNKTDLARLFVRTKELFILIVPYLSGHTLKGALRIQSSNDQELAFLSDQHNIAPSSLRECKAKLRKYLTQLEDQGVISKENGYQDLFMSIATDICNKHKYRQQQTKELEKLTASLANLQEKTKFYEEQIHYYHQYIERCLENLSASKRNVHCVKRAHANEKPDPKHSLKFNGAKLHENGVLISIEGLPVPQFKNIQFEISPTNHHGIFAISGKFMGVDVEQVEIDMQELLQLQYNGVGVKDIFGKAKININLLLHLLNTKYYKKM